MTNFKQPDLTEQIIKAFYAVYNTLGYGFLERVYGSALVIELHKSGIQAKPQTLIHVSYDGKVIGEYFQILSLKIVLLLKLRLPKVLLLNTKPNFLTT